MTGLLRLLLLGGLVGALEAACRAGWVAPTSVIPPSAMAAALWALLRSGAVWPDLRVTLLRVGLATLVGGVGGAGLGALLHAVPRLRRAVEPVLSAWYAVPVIMFYPVLLVVFGVGTPAIVAIAVLLGGVAMAVSTAAGLDAVPCVLLRTARTLRLGPGRTAWLVQLPAMAPALLSGLRLVLAYAFIGVIASEFILSGSGLGYAIANAYNDFDNRTMYGLMLLVVVLVTTANAGLAAVAARLPGGRR